MKGSRVKIGGIVQGVGFRPFIYKLAQVFALKGRVYNEGSGVTIEIAGYVDIDAFLSMAKELAPPLAKIETVTIEDAIEFTAYTDFSIAESLPGSPRDAELLPDISICDACSKELFDPNNRRFRHPFISCTQCGPRYTILEKLPFDRTRTTMDAFKMCPLCDAEYRDPSSRRFHAQTICCKDCGPTLSLLKGSDSLSQEERVQESIRMIKEGSIVAVKGIGGYHLLCDATNEEAVARLRERKRRPKKPFAVMVESLDEAKSLIVLDERSIAALSSGERPIVLAPKADAAKNGVAIAKSVAPGTDKMGIFLGYTPLHLLILQGVKRPLIATSANISDEPIATGTQRIKTMDHLWDACLDHDREILHGCDDSVVLAAGNELLQIRRARGIAPGLIRLPGDLKRAVLAVGGHQKNSVAIAYENKVILSPHIGDLGSIESMASFEAHIESLCAMYEVKPELILCDKHSGYLSHIWAKKQGVEVREVQHHYAHILSVMLSEEVDSEVLGVAFDGTGMGDDGTLWGGEFIKAGYRGYERVAYLRPMRLLGGDQAAKEPRRVALSLLFDLYGERVLTMRHPAVESFTPLERESLWKAFQKGINAPLSSSMGRLFDGVASLGDLCQMQSFEGESGALMECYFDEKIEGEYPFGYEGGEIDYRPMIEALFFETDRSVMITKFFRTVVEMVKCVARQQSLPLLFCGGVFQNAQLAALLLKAFPEAAFGRHIPSNDGGIALGQVGSVMEEE